MRLIAIATASPIRRMGTSMGTAGGSLAEDGRSQEPTALVAHDLLDHLVGAIVVIGWLNPSRNNVPCIEYRDFGRQRRMTWDNARNAPFAVGQMRCH